MSQQNRRVFLQQAAAGAAAATFAISGTKASGRVIGANDRVRLGVAGIKGRGGSHIESFAKMQDVDVTYLIDPDSRLFASRVKQVEQLGGNTPKCVQDIRQALEDKELDAVSIASCNHTHALLTFWSCEAGKDVYVEKPCSHNVFEGRQCVTIARKNGCIVQHGTQSRGSSSWARQVAAIASGKYGKLLVSKAYASKPRWSIGFKEPKDPPPELDFNLWLGPAPKQPYHENIVHYNWHWFWDFGNGEIGNQGVHQMDIARWAIPGGTLPKSVISLGRRWVNEADFRDQGETPNLQLTVMDFGGPLLVFEVAGLCGRDGKVSGQKIPGRVDNEFYLEAGVIRGGRFYPKGSDKAESLVDVKVTMPPGDVFANFIHAMRTRNPKDLHADILDAHYSSACCHLGNISYRLGKEVAGTTAPVGLPDNPQVAESLQALKTQLKDALDLDWAKTTYQMGVKLNFDPEKEEFIGNDQANQLLTRDYREPFVVPNVS
jgi:predicted dehydrogenase